MVGAQSETRYLVLGSQAISEYYGESRRRFFLHPELKDGALRTIVSNEHEDIAAEIARHLRFERVQVFVGPIEFKSRAVK